MDEKGKIKYKGETILGLGLPTNTFTEDIQLRWHPGDSIHKPHIDKVEYGYFGGKKAELAKYRIDEIK
ncbi:MAG: hypothetical protein CVT88_07510 [Candidatus Altiarchaeales archaeon HGW-Altiarchaeales-1]|nr:MAG: hypothetical protein CVT88_07510 [Candidatus Altiarchaeales archaeon HGW-Altiarchaeales-1]